MAQISEPSELQVVKQDRSDGPGLTPCRQQTEPARKLINLVGIPELLVSAEAGYHRSYDHCTAKWINQAGGKADFVGLETVGLRGNGDEMMLEKNSLEIATFLEGWIEKNVR